MVRYLVVDGEPIVLREGFSGYDIFFDEKGKPQRMTYVDGRGNPVMTRH